MAFAVATAGAAFAAALAAAAIPSPAHAQTQPGAEARAVLESALTVMGGEGALRDIQTASFTFMTQWQRTEFRGLPGADRPSFEVHHDRRDYRIPAWRNTRAFGARAIVNVVRDSVATTDMGDGPRPLNVAYVDERRELFTYTPDRLLLALADAPELRLGADTTLAGEPHRRLQATLRGRWPAEVFVHAAAHTATLLRFTAGHPNDYGLVPWGEMTVAVWYNGWRQFGDIAIPTQWDVFRVGRPYKRMTVRGAAFNVDLPADSFAVSPESRSAFLASQRDPMHELQPITRVHEVAPGLVAIEGFGYPLGAVRAGGAWLLVEAGQTGWNLERALERLEAEGIGPVAGVLALAADPENGGVVAAAGRGLRIYVSPGSAPFVERILANAGASAELQVITDERRLGEGAEAVELVPFALPDAPASTLVHHPASGWLWAPGAAAAFGLRRATEAATERGWQVTRTGTGRRLVLPAEAGSG